MSPLDAVLHVDEAEEVVVVGGAVFLDVCLGSADVKNAAADVENAASPLATGFSLAARPTGAMRPNARPTGAMRTQNLESFSGVALET